MPGLRAATATSCHRGVGRYNTDHKSQKGYLPNREGSVLVMFSLQAEGWEGFFVDPKGEEVPQSWLSQLWYKPDN